ncbi:MAG: DUF1311 domain-containing protein [Neisseriaceae bacterium]|nr:DUF1311 domain-containing protein [Neisseriaceae bacterium]
MNKLILGFGLSALFALAACGGEDKNTVVESPISCTNPEASQFLLDDISKKATQATYGLKNLGWDVSEEKINAILAQLQFKIDNIRTENQAEGKVSCLASYTIDLPASVLKQAEEGFEYWGDVDQSLMTTLSDYSWQKSGSALNKNIEYTIQQTDDGKKILTHLDQPNATADGLHYLLAGHLAYDYYAQAMAAEAENEREYAEREAQLQSLDDERVMATVNEAKELNKFAHQRLNAVWKALPDGVRTELTAVQKAWNEKRASECRYTASANAERTPEQSLIMVQCDTELVEDRTSFLESMARRHDNNALASAEKQLSGLKSQMQQTWATFPREVKEALQVEQNDWQSDTQTICTSKRSQTEDQEASKLLYTQCMVEETKKRIAVLKTFQV